MFPDAWLDHWPTLSSRRRSGFQRLLDPEFAPRMTMSLSKIVMRSLGDLVLVDPQVYGEAYGYRKLSVAFGFDWPKLPDRWVMYRISDSIMIA